MLPSQSAEVILTFEPEDLSPPILDNPFIKSNKIDKIDQVDFLFKYLELVFCPGCGTSHHRSS